MDMNAWTTMDYLEVLYATYGAEWGATPDGWYVVTLGGLAWRVHPSGKVIACWDGRHLSFYDLEAEVRDVAEIIAKK